MSHVPRPSSTDEMVEQLWYAIIGTNGDGALVQIKQNRQATYRVEKKLNRYLRKERKATCYYLAAVSGGRVTAAEHREAKRVRLMLLALIPAYAGTAFGLFQLIRGLVVR